MTSTRIGDAVLSSGLVQHLIRTHPEARLTIACGPVAAPLFEAVPGLDRVIVLAKRPWAGHWLGLWAATVTTFWDLIVDLRGSVATMVLPRRRRLAYYTDRAPVHRLIALSKVLDLAEPAPPALWTGPAHDAEAARLTDGTGPVLALGPTANWPCKEWPVARFVELAARLTGDDGPLPGARVMVLGAPSERETARPLIDALAPDRVIEVFDNVPLLTAYACLKRADLYIGNDSGLMHMAAAAGVPTLGLFGPTQDRHYAPFGPLCAVVRTPETYEELMGRTDALAGRTCLMGSLTVDAVDRAARGLLARAREAA
ncbi:MAG: glycosyltransferase family 9 protein [Alphaproteobacteria bacterium]|nr:glycosyltransferase family 9 protein [Alphaproteobacteria bacterium]